MRISGKEQIGRGKVALFCACAVLLAGSLAWWKIRPPASMVRGDPLKSLNDEVAGLRAYGTAALQAKAAQAAILRSRLWTAERWADWKRKVPEKWTVQDLPGDKQKYTFTRRVMLNRRDATATDWPEIYGVLQGLGDEEGVIIRGLTVAMTNQENQKFEAVEVIATIPFAREEKTAPAKEPAGKARP